jgi:hypothetical protein
MEAYKQVKVIGRGAFGAAILCYRVDDKGPKRKDLIMKEVRGSLTAFISCAGPPAGTSNSSPGPAVAQHTRLKRLASGLALPPLASP